MPMKSVMLIPPGRLSAEALRELRRARQENQTKFWQRFGVTQSRGSRFETGFEIPPSVAILIGLYLDGTVNDVDLKRVRRNHRNRKKSASARSSIRQNNA